MLATTYRLIAILKLRPTSRRIWRDDNPDGPVANNDAAYAQFGETRPIAVLVAPTTKNKRGEELLRDLLV
jgi:hypothetical protein